MYILLMSAEWDSYPTKTNVFKDLSPFVVFNKTKREFLHTCHISLFSMNDEWWILPWVNCNSLILKRIELINKNKAVTVYTLSGRMGNVVASHAEAARSSPAEDALIYTMHEALREYCHEGGGSDQSIGSTVSGAIVRSWLWSTATRTSPLRFFKSTAETTGTNTFTRQWLMDLHLASGLTFGCWYI